MIEKHRNFWLVAVMALCGLLLVMQQRIARGGPRSSASDNTVVIDLARFSPLCAQLDSTEDAYELLPDDLLAWSEPPAPLETSHATARRSMLASR